MLIDPEEIAGPPKDELGRKSQASLGSTMQPQSTPKIAFEVDDE